MASFDISPLFISLATTCAATIATFFLGLYAAKQMFGMEGRFRVWIDGLLTLPLVLPPTVVGFFLLLVFGRHSFIGRALSEIGITIVFSWPATVIAATVVAFPLMYRTALGAFEQVNPKLLDAARTLGASEGRVFRRVLLPIAAPGVLAGTVLAFARALGEFGATLMLAGNIPGRTQTMPMAIFSAVEDGNMPLAFLWVSLIVVLSVGIIRLLHWKIGTRRPARARAAAPGDVTVHEELPARLSQIEKSAISATIEVDVKKALKNFNMEVAFQSGQGAVGLLGPSGAGKSMTLRMIAGIVTPDSGHIELNGRVLFDSAKGRNIPPARRRIGVVFQDYALFPNMTVAENVSFGLSALPKWEREERVTSQLEAMHIEELAGRYPSEISGGQRQRVAIARCMATDPDALLFDEPFAALDPHLRRHMEEQLRETLAGYEGAVIFVTHDMEEAFRFCSDLLVLDGGQIIASGPKHQLFEHPPTVAAAQLTGCKNIVEAWRVGTNRIAVGAWNCELQTTAPVPHTLTHVGIRSHQLVFQAPAKDVNTLLCWLVGTSEAPHEITLYLRLHAPARPGELAQLQADVPKELWRTLSALPQPWNVKLDPARLLLLEG